MVSACVTIHISSCSDTARRMLSWLAVGGAAVAGRTHRAVGRQMGRTFQGRKRQQKGNHQNAVDHKTPPPLPPPPPALLSVYRKGATCLPRYRGVKGGKHPALCWNYAVYSVTPIKVLEGDGVREGKERGGGFPEKCFAPHAADAGCYFLANCVWVSVWEVSTRTICGSQKSRVLLC